jgi:hypothetical protein
MQPSIAAPFFKQAEAVIADKPEPKSAMPAGLLAAEIWISNPSNL